MEWCCYVAVELSGYKNVSMTTSVASAYYASSKLSLHDWLHRCVSLATTYTQVACQFRCEPCMVQAASCMQNMHVVEVCHLQTLCAVCHVQHLLTQAVNLRAKAGELLHVHHATQLL